MREGARTPEVIDTVVKRGMNHPMGPLTLADFIGLDVCLAILELLHDGLGDPKYRAYATLITLASQSRAKNVPATTRAGALPARRR